MISLNDSVDLPNNLVDFVINIVSQSLKYYKVYSGKVMSRETSGENQGIIEVYAGEFCGINEFDSSSWLICKPAINSNSSVIPDRGDYVYFTFRSGTPDEPIYFGQAYDYYKYLNDGEKKVVFEYSGMIKDSSIYLDETRSKFVIKHGSKTPEKSVLGETLKEKLEDLIDLVKNIQVMTPVGPSGTVGSYATQGSDLEFLKIELVNILSENLENN